MRHAVILLYPASCNQQLLFFWPSCHLTTVNKEGWLSSLIPLLCTVLLLDVLHCQFLQAVRVMMGAISTVIRRIKDTPEPSAVAHYEHSGRPMRAAAQSASRALAGRQVRSTGKQVPTPVATGLYCSRTPKCICNGTFQLVEALAVVGQQGVCRLVHHRLINSAMK